MRTLALDTSTNQGGIAVLNGRDLLSRRVWTREKSHSEMLTSTLEDCLREAQIGTRDIQRIAVGKGPGSFTGIRIAVNAARALAYSLSIPVFAFDTTEILVHGVTPDDRPCLALVNAHKNLLYASRFEPKAGIGGEPKAGIGREPKAGLWERRDGPRALSLAEIEAMIQTEHICIGDGFAEIDPILPTRLRALLTRLPSASDFPLPEVLGTLVERLHAKPLVWNELQALYIRASEAEEKLRESLENRSGE